MAQASPSASPTSSLPAGTGGPGGVLDSLIDSRTATIERMRSSILNGVHWAEALLAAVGRWTAPSETVDGVHIQYLVGGEAFDWLLLAERLLRVVPDGCVPLEDRDRLLFKGMLPADVSDTDFRSALGPEKYRAHLNFFYGVVVEEALWHAVEREVEKERGVRGLRHPVGVQDLVAERLYRADLGALVRRFQRERGRGRSMRLSLADLRELTYWLFKRRLAGSDQARAASDTRKGLGMLNEIRERAGAPAFGAPAV